MPTRVAQLVVVVLCAWCVSACADKPEPGSIWFDRLRDTGNDDAGVGDASPDAFAADGSRQDVTPPPDTGTDAIALDGSTSDDGVDGPKDAGERDLPPVVLMDVWDGTLTWWEQAIWDAICEASFCVHPNNAIFFRGLVTARYASEAECKANPNPQWVSVERRQSVDEGRTVVDPAALARCLQRLRDHHCGNGYPPKYISVYDECRYAFGGQVGDGGDCLNDYDCQSGLFCNPRMSGCAGECGPPLPGMPNCGLVSCGPDEFCLQDEMGGPPSCVPKLPEGSKCPGLDTCEVGLQCWFFEEPDLDDFSPTGTCIPRYSVPLGSRCDYYDLCLEGLYCETETLTCEPYVPIPQGSPCRVWGDLGCEVGNVCGDMDPATGMGNCGPPKTVGGVCFQSADCAPGLYCDVPMGVLGTCADPKPVGEPCNWNDECQSARCLDTLCVPFGPSCRIP